MTPDVQTPRGKGAPSGPGALALGPRWAYPALAEECGSILPHPGDIATATRSADSGQAHGRMTNRKGAR
jgi:hypothetical protein